MSKTCGRCGKSFKNQTCVKKHQSQRKSYCRTLYEETLRINQALAAETSTCSEQLDPCYSPPSPPKIADQLFGLQGSSSSEDLPPEDDAINTDVLPSQSQAQISPGPVHSAQPFYTSEFDSTSKGTGIHIEKYPSASQTCGKGETFLDLFRKDTFKEKRQAFPYYPFASKDEWELAYFLLHSDLSMNAQNDLLKTKLVRNP